eukprot:CAMPEP_0170590832 /NCGR_PEP_ID=MMETSP0224-20130122/12079_1 /TAXON_ID=285029 /ORGANISM="Togula jolla, Strain CCCM 725" /LENGTH=65 /DNA_ID=CAMNT_0010914653 /DNA_START=573 /DNA_END=767 /DNA_ORIENTATION=+
MAHSQCSALSRLSPLAQALIRELNVSIPGSTPRCSIFLNHASARAASPQRAQALITELKVTTLAG